MLNESWTINHIRGFNNSFQLSFSETQAINDKLQISVNMHCSGSVLNLSEYQKNENFNQTTYIEDKEPTAADLSIEISRKKPTRKIYQRYYRY